MGRASIRRASAAHSISGVPHRRRHQWQVAVSVCTAPPGRTSPSCFGGMQRIVRGDLQSRITIPPGAIRECRFHKHLQQLARPSPRRVGPRFSCHAPSPSPSNERPLQSVQACSCLPAVCLDPTRTRRNSPVQDRQRSHSSASSSRSLGGNSSWSVDRSFVASGTAYEHPLFEFNASTRGVRLRSRVSIVG